jgi:hypothetical protein
MINYFQKDSDDINYNLIEAAQQSHLTNDRLFSLIKL